MTFELSKYDIKNFQELGFKLVHKLDKEIEYSLNEQYSIGIQIKDVMHEEQHRIVLVGILNNGHRDSEIHTFVDADTMKLDIFKEIDFIDDLIKVLLSEKAITVLEEIAFECLLGKTNVISESLLDPSIKQEVLKSKIIRKSIKESIKYEFINQGFIYSVARNYIYKRNQKYQKGILKIIKDDVFFLSKINCHLMFCDFSGYKKLKLKHKQILDCFIEEAKYELAAQERDQFSNKLRETIVLHWPVFEEGIFESVIE